MIVVNAANIEKDWDHIVDQKQRRQRPAPEHLDGSGPARGAGAHAPRRCCSR